MKWPIEGLRTRSAGGEAAPGGGHRNARRFRRGLKPIGAHSAIDTTKERYSQTQRKQKRHSFTSGEGSASPVENHQDETVVGDHICRASQRQRPFQQLL